jgi:hypothetical protein
MLLDAFVLVGADADPARGADARFQPLQLVTGERPSRMPLRRPSPIAERLSRVRAERFAALACALVVLT